MAQPITLAQDVSLVQETAPAESWSIFDADGNPVDVHADALLFVAYSDDGQTQTELFQHGSGGHLSVSSNTISVAFQLSDTIVPVIASYILRDLTSSLALAQGDFVVSPAASGIGSGG